MYISYFFEPNGHLLKSFKFFHIFVFVNYRKMPMKSATRREDKPIL